jgi:uncharacterized Rmd1/YagE family protein
MDDLLEYLRQKNPVHRTAPKKFDEVIYTPFAFSQIQEIELEALEKTLDQFGRDSPAIANVDDFLEQNIDAEGRPIPGSIQYEHLAKRIAPIGEILVYDYGVVVFWGFTPDEEQVILRDIEKFEEDTLTEEELETEQFYFHYNTFYQPRIYNDIITLKNPANFMLKITISHAIAQSVKLTLFEGKVEETIENTKHVPLIMAEEVFIF